MDPLRVRPVSTKHVLASDNYSLHRHRGHVATLLARMGTGLDLVLALLDQAMGKPDDVSRIRAGVFSALASLAERESPDRKSTLRTKISAVPVQAHPLAEADRLVALRSLGAEVSISPALELALTYKNESDDGAVWTRLAALDLVATRSDVPATLAIPLVHCSNVRLHRAAVRALRARKHPVPEVKVYDPLTVAELATRGPEALANALSDDRGLAREHIVFALDRDSIVQLRAPLEAFARSLTRAPLFGPNAYALRWTIEALTVAPGSEPLFNELLTSFDEVVVEAVLRNAKAMPSGIERGMTSALTRMSGWKKREAAAWLQEHPSEASTRALSELGLAPEDLKWMSKTH